MAKKILVVDDDSTLAQCIQELLESEGYEVAVFSLGSAFRNAFTNEPLVITDLQMEDDDAGLKNAFHAKCASPEVKVILMSADILMLTEADQQHKDIVDLCVVKPFRMFSLADHVHNLIGRP